MIKINYGKHMISILITHKKNTMQIMVKIKIYIYIIKYRKKDIFIFFLIYFILRFKQFKNNIIQYTLLKFTIYA